METSDHNSVLLRMAEVEKRIAQLRKQLVRGDTKATHEGKHPEEARTFQVDYLGNWLYLWVANSYFPHENRHLIDLALDSGLPYPVFP